MAGPYSPNPGKLISSTQPITQPLFEMLRTHSIFSEYSEWLDYDIEQAVYKGIWAKRGVVGIRALAYREAQPITPAVPRLIDHIQKEGGGGEG